MTEEEKVKVINALNLIYDWIDYVPDCYLEKHGWRNDNSNIQNAISIVRRSGNETVQVPTEES